MRTILLKFEGPIFKYFVCLFSLKYFLKLFLCQLLHDSFSKYILVSICLFYKKNIFGSWVITVLLYFLVSLHLCFIKTAVVLFDAQVFYTFIMNFGLQL